MPGLDTCLLYASIPRMKTLTFPLLAPPPARDLVSGARRGAARRVHYYPSLAHAAAASTSLVTTRSRWGKHGSPDQGVTDTV